MVAADTVVRFLCVCRQMKRSWNSDQKRQIAAQMGWRCGVCNQLLNSAYEVDHVVALENGGADDIQTNAQAICSNCHGLKTQKERVLRIQKARERLKELQKHSPPEPKKAVARQPEDVILDSSNPFARFAFLPNMTL